MRALHILILRFLLAVWGEKKKKNIWFYGFKDLTCIVQKASDSLEYSGAIIHKNFTNALHCFLSLEKKKKNCTRTPNQLPTGLKTITLIEF